MLRCCGLVIAIVCMFSHVALAEELKVEVVLEGLSNPFGVAIQPESGTVFIADSGHGKVVRVVDGKSQDVITGFPKEAFGRGPTYDIGPLALAFVDQETLAVAGGGLPVGEEQLALYNVPASGKPAIPASEAKQAFTLPSQGDSRAEGNFFGLAATASALYVTSSGDEAKGWLSKSEISGTKVGDLTRFIPTKALTGIDTPSAIAINPRGELVVSQSGKLDVAEDSVIAFFSAKTGQKLLSLPTNLHDISALAYSPKGATPQLYALDFAWQDNARGGLFQLVVERKGSKQILQAKKIAAIDRPTAMTFASDGTLYITCIGAGQNGQLLKIAPGL